MPLYKSYGFVGHTGARLGTTGGSVFRGSARLRQSALWLVTGMNGVTTRRSPMDEAGLARSSLFAFNPAFFRGASFVSPFIFRGAFLKTGCGADLAH